MVASLLPGSEVEGLYFDFHLEQVEGLLKEIMEVWRPHTLCPWRFALCSFLHTEPPEIHHSEWKCCNPDPCSYRILSSWVSNSSVFPYLSNDCNDSWPCEISLLSDIGIVYFQVVLLVSCGEDRSDDVSAAYLSDHQLEAFLLVVVLKLTNSSLVSIQMCPFHPYCCRKEERNGGSPDIQIRMSQLPEAYVTSYIQGLPYFPRPRRFPTRPIICRWEVYIGDLPRTFKEQC